MTKDTCRFGYKGHCVSVVSSVLYETNPGTEISIFVPRPRDIAHPSSGPAQDLPCQALLRVVSSGAYGVADNSGLYLLRR